MRHWKSIGVLLAVLVSGLFFVLITRSNTIQRDTDARIAADVDGLIAEKLASLKSDDPIIRRYGEFQSWEPAGWERPHYLGMLVSHLNVNGVAHFTTADADISIMIAQGPKAVRLQTFPSEQWLQDHPEHQIVVSGRRLVQQSSGSVAAFKVEAFGTHPDFKPD